MKPRMQEKTNKKIKPKQVFNRVLNIHYNFNNFAVNRASSWTHFNTANTPPQKCLYWRSVLPAESCIFRSDVWKFVVGNEIYCCLGDVVDAMVAPIAPFGKDGHTKALLIHLYTSYLSEWKGITSVFALVGDSIGAWITHFVPPGWRVQVALLRPFCLDH